MFDLLLLALLVYTYLRDAALVLPTKILQMSIELIITSADRKIKYLIIPNRRPYHQTHQKISSVAEKYFKKLLKNVG
jgi:hypothetical protein